MRVQLFVPPGGYFAERWTQGSSMPPLGLLYIGAFLEKEGHEIQIVPADLLQLSWSQVAGEIRDFEPDLIGVTSTTENRFQSFRLVQVAKKVRPAAHTIMGGPHASMAAEDCLEHVQDLDIVCRGEGEQTMLELCRELEGKNDLNALSSIAGISYKANGKVYSNSQREPIKDLDSIPRPAYHLVPFEKYNFRFEVPGRGLLPAVNMMSSRGCPFNCNFCATPINWGRVVRMRSPQNIVEEIEFLIDTYGVKVIFFFDDTFNTSPKRVHEICDLIIERKLNIFFKCDIRIDIIDKSLLEKMKQAGLFHLSFGLEAGSERVRNEIVNKKVNIEDFHNLVKWCQELDIIPNAFSSSAIPPKHGKKPRRRLISSRSTKKVSSRVSPSFISIRAHHSRRQPKKRIFSPKISPGRKDTAPRLSPCLQPKAMSRYLWISSSGRRSVS